MKGEGGYLWSVVGFQLGLSEKAGIISSGMWSAVGASEGGCWSGGVKMVMIYYGQQM